jgi:lysophospholipase L1-like esterase
LGEDIRIIALGDSIVLGHRDETGRGWLGNLVEHARGAGLILTVYALGVRRDASPQLARRAHAEVGARLDDAADPSEIGRRLLVGVGIADAVRQIPDSIRETSLDEILRLSRTNALRLALVGPPPVSNDGDDPDGVAMRVERVGAWLGDYAEDRGIRYFGLHDELAGDAWAAALDPRAGGDGFHPTAAGYRQMSKVLIRNGLLDWLRTPGDQANEGPGHVR